MAIWTTRIVDTLRAAMPTAVPTPHQLMVLTELMGLFVSIDITTPRPDSVVIVIEVAERTAIVHDALRLLDLRTRDRIAASPRLPGRRQRSYDCYGDNLPCNVLVRGMDGTNTND